MGKPQDGTRLPENFPGGAVIPVLKNLGVISSDVPDFLNWQNANGDLIKALQFDGNVTFSDVPGETKGLTGVREYKKALPSLSGVDMVVGLPLDYLKGAPGNFPFPLCRTLRLEFAPKALAALKTAGPPAPVKHFHLGGGIAITPREIRLEDVLSCPNFFDSLLGRIKIFYKLICF